MNGKRLQVVVQRSRLLSGKKEEACIKHMFTAMIEGIHEPAIKSGIVEQHVFEKGVKDLYRTTEPDGVFCYTFFKAVGKK